MNKLLKYSKKLLQKIVFTFVVGINFYQISYSQSVKRIEIPVPNENFQVQVISLKEEGLLLLSKTGKTSFSVTKFDENLNKSFTLDGQLDENQSYVDFYLEGRDVYLLFAKQNSDLYHIIRISTGIGIMTKFVFEAISRFEISEFKVNKGIAYLAGMVREEPVLMSIGLNISKPRIIAGGMKGTASITSIDFDEAEDLVNVTYSVKKGRSSYVVIKKINVNGKIIKQSIIEPEDDFGLLTGKTFTTTDGTELLIGNFGYRGYESNGVPMSQGLYIGKIGDETEFLNYHSFTDFKNFFKFMSARQQEKIEKQIERKKERGSDLKLNYRVLVHDVIKKDNQYILVAEVFYPEFRYNYNNPYGFSNFWGSPFWGRSMIYNPYLVNRYWGLNSWAWNPWLWSNNSFSNQQLFDGFKYTHAVVAGFDEKGKLLWDNSFSFDEVKSMNLKEKVKVKVDNGDVLTLVYSNKGKLNSKIIKGSEILEGNKSIEISTDKEGDKVRDNQNEDIEYWYENFYLAYGYQKISNRNDGSRRVFYLNKIEF